MLRVVLAPLAGVLARNAMTLVRVAAAALAWLLIGVAALLVSLAYHVSLPAAHDVGRDVLNRFVTGEIRGELRVGRVDELSAGRVVVRHVQLFDPYGTRVAVADRVVLTPDLDAALLGTLRFSSARLTGGTIRLDGSPREDSVLPTFIETFEPTQPSAPGSEPLHAVVDGILVEDTVIYGSFLDLEGLRVEDVRLTGRLESTDEFEVRIFSGDGNVVRPFPFVGNVDHVSGVIHTDPLIGVRLHAAGGVERPEGPDDRVAVNVTYAVPEGGDRDDESHLHVLVHGDPVHARFLEEVGYSWAESFRDDAAIEGWFRLRGPIEDLEMRVWAQTPGGRVRVVGRIDEQGVDLTGGSPSLALAEVVEDWPDVEVSGRGRMQIETAVEGAPARIRIEGQPFFWEGYAIPALVLEGEVHDDHLQIASMEAPYSGGDLTASGRYGFDGAMDVQVRGHIPQIAADPNIRRHVPDARGSMHLDAHLVTGSGESERIGLNGVIVLRNFRYGPLRAERLRLDGWISGRASQPRLQVQADGEAVSVAGYALGRAEMDVDGGPRTYRASGRFRRGDAQQQLYFDASVASAGRTWVVDAPQLELTVDAGRVWRGAIENLVYDPDRSVQAQSIRLASGSQRLESHGVWRFRGPEEISAELQGFDLTALEALLGDAMPPITGTLDTHLQITGDIERPNIVAEGFLREGTVIGVEDVTALYAIGYEEGNLTVDGQVDLGERGSLALSGTGMLDPTVADPVEAIENGTYDMELAVGDLQLAVIRSIIGETTALPMDGVIAGTVEMEGPVFAPALHGTLAVPELSIVGFDPLGVETFFDYENGVLVARVITTDGHGELAEAEGSLLIDLVNLVQNTDETLASLESQPWRFSVRVPSRQLGQLPGTLLASIPEDLHPLRVSLSGTFAGGAFETRGDLMANLDWEGDPQDITCEPGGAPRAVVEGTFRDGVTTLDLRGFVGNQRVVRAQATAATPLDQWLTDADVPGVPPVRLTALVQNAPTQKIPIVCEYADGSLTAALEVNDLFGAEPNARLELHSPGVRILETQAIRLDGIATLHDGALTAEAGVSWWSGERANLDLRIPMTWGGAQWAPEIVSDGDTRFEGRFQAAPMGPFIAWLPQIEDVSGFMDGTVVASGPLDELSVEGSVEMYDGYLELVGLGQHLTDVTGRVTFRGNWAELEGIRAWDGEGLLRIDGGIGLAGYRPSRARLALNTDAFPVRHEGTVLATLTGSATLAAEIGTDKTEIALDVLRLDVRLPEEETRSVQELESHGDIVIVGREQEEREEDTPYVVQIAVDANEPFWVRRNDFASMVTADLDVEYSDPDLRVWGDVVLRRGFFEVFGKRFVIDRGSMGFGGGTELDPEVILVASHEMRTATSATVTVTVTGTLTQPDVEFRSTHPECVERAEVVTMLISGRCNLAQASAEDERAASEQAANVLAGITAGVLTLSLRKELGDVLPVIAVESGSRAGTGRIRAGFDASSVIPEFLRGVVRGAYVEGVVATADPESGEEQQGGPRPGFLIELQFPHDLVLSGEMQSDTDWRTDLTWEP